LLHPVQKAVYKISNGASTPLSLPPCDGERLFEIPVYVMARRWWPAFGPRPPCLCSSKMRAEAGWRRTSNYDTRLRFSLSPSGEEGSGRGRSSDCPDPLARTSVSHAKSDPIRPKMLFRYLRAKLANRRPALA